MADEPKRDAEQPDEDAQKVIDQLKKEGNTFENLDDKVDLNKKEPPEDKKVEDEEELAKKKQEEEANKEEEELKKAEEEEKKAEKALPREPRKPYWVHKMEERREKQKQQKESNFLEQINSLKTEIEDLKKVKAPSAPQLSEEIADKIKVIKEKYADVDSTFIDELVSLFPKKDDSSTEIKQKLEELSAKVSEFEGLKTDRKKEAEDIEYSKNFTSKITPLIKQDFPMAIDADISAIEQKLRDSYFDERYIKLGIEEIYAIKRNDLSNEISPEHRQAGELGKRGVGRDTDIIDYDNVSEEDFKKMSLGEQAKVIEHKSKNSRL